MNDPLYNPVFAALCSGNRRLGFGTEKAKAFDQRVSPFAGFTDGHAGGFADLYDLLPAGRRILYASPEPVALPKGWTLQHRVPGVQMLFSGKAPAPPTPTQQPLPLTEDHVDEMTTLATLTRPGPFGPRTIDFGHYHGFFAGGKLVAMAGQRLQVAGFAEISAVCTHPDHLGKGYASALVQHQVNRICAEGQTPFLHVRDDNRRAIALYERLGFAVRRPMIFYFLRKEGAV